MYLVNVTGSFVCTVCVLLLVSLHASHEILVSLLPTLHVNVDLSLSTPKRHKRGETTSALDGDEWTSGPGRFTPEMEHRHQLSRKLVGLQCGLDVSEKLRCGECNTGVLISL